MRFGQISLLASLLAIAASVPASASGPNDKPRLRRGPTSAHAKAAPTRPRLSALSIEPERATQIQTALIGAGYLTGAPSGAWDATSAAAMMKFQGDNGWQTKIVPDSRAIIKLGLGSSYAPATFAAAPPVAEPEPVATAN